MYMLQMCFCGSSFHFPYFTLNLETTQSEKGCKNSQAPCEKKSQVTRLGETTQDLWDNLLTKFI